MARLISWNAPQALPPAPFSSPRRLSRTNCSPLPALIRPSAAPTAFLRAGREAHLLHRPCPSLSSFSRVHCQRQGEPPQGGTSAPEPVQNHAALQASLWLLAGVYVFWLFILPYAPGDPIWAIKLDTILMLLDLSLNFLFILPLMNLLGVHFLESPVVHPTAEALFNLVIGWTTMFAPLLFTDKRRKRFSGSLTALWGIQMFLTNTVLIPYMAIRLNQENHTDDVSSQVGSVKIDLKGVQNVMVSGARVVSVMCGTAGITSILWFFLGRPDEGFGNLSDRWAFFLEYLSTDRLGYAFIWDICLYSLFQPWLIGDNLQKIDISKAKEIQYLRYIPYVGLVAYLWVLSSDCELES